MYVLSNNCVSCIPAIMKQILVAKNQWKREKREEADIAFFCDTIP